MSCFVLKVARLREIQISYKIVLTIKETITAFGSDRLSVRKIRFSKDRESEESLSRRGWKYFQTSSNQLRRKKQCSSVSEQLRKEQRSLLI